MLFLINFSFWKYVHISQKLIKETTEKYSMFFVYLLECADGTFYTGQTNNLQRRMSEHKKGKGAKYVRSRLPFTLKYAETHPTRGHAMRRENEIKSWNRRKKRQLFLGDPRIAG